MRETRTRGRRGIRLLAAVVAAVAVAAIPTASGASHGGCAPGNPALGRVAVGNANGDTDWYDASSTETQYIRAERALNGVVELRMWAWDGATGCTLVDFNPCTQLCWNSPAMGPFPPGSYLLSVHGSSGDYAVTSLPLDLYEI